MIPAVWVMVDELPLTESGKLDRKALPQPDVRSRGDFSFVSPQNVIESKLVHIWEEVLQVKPISVNDNFFDLGGHSILALRLMGEIHDQLGCKLSLTELFQHGTVKQLSNIVRNCFSPVPSSPLVCLQSHGSNTPVFFVHVGSGDVMCYLDLARCLGKSQPFYGLRDPALHDNYELEMTIEERAMLYLKHVRKLRTHGPYLLGGYSFGGLVAFEMARQLRQAGETIGLLALLDTGSPDFVRQIVGFEDDATLLGIIARELGLAVRDKELRVLAPEARLSYLVELMKKANLHWNDAVEFLKRQLALFQSRNRVVRQYFPQPYDGVITFFRASETHIEFECDNIPAVIHDSTRGFSTLTTHPVEVYLVPGSHHQMVREPGVQILASALSNCIDKAFHTAEKEMSL
jgi:thioesterase domain-containing protein/acyl carrier protein